MTVTREQLEKVANMVGVEIEEYQEKFYLKNQYCGDSWSIAKYFNAASQWDPLADRGQLLDVATACKIGIDPVFNRIKYFIPKHKFMCKVEVDCQDFPALAEAVILAACEQFDAQRGEKK